MKRIAIGILLAMALLGCFAKKETSEVPEVLKTGTWRATIEIQEQLLPFNLDV